MNFSCFIPAAVGGLLALFTFRQVEHRPVITTQSVLMPAVVRVFETRNTPATHLAKSYRGTSIESFLDQNPEEFRRLTSREIETCALALEGMINRADRGVLGSRSYLHTRLRALQEHVDYARNELMKLPSNQGDEDFISAHAHFYRTIKSLDQAFAQAATELYGDT